MTGGERVLLSVLVGTVAAVLIVNWTEIVVAWVRYWRSRRNGGNR